MGIALWAIEGLRRLLANDQFTLPEASAEHLRGIKELTNPLGAMIDECCEFGPMDDFRANCATLYDLWLGWCHKTKTRSDMSRIAFGMKLGHLQKPMVRKQFMEGGKRTWAYAGVRIRPQAMEEYLMT